MYLHIVMRYIPLILKKRNDPLIDKRHTLYNL